MLEINFSTPYLQAQGLGTSNQGLTELRSGRLRLVANLINLLQLLDFIYCILDVMDVL